MPRRRMPSDWASLARHLLLQTRVRGFRGDLRVPLKGSIGVTTRVFIRVTIGV